MNGLAMVQRTPDREFETVLENERARLAAARYATPSFARSFESAEERAYVPAYDIGALYADQEPDESKPGESIIALCDHLIEQINRDEPNAVEVLHKLRRELARNFHPDRMPAEQQELANACMSKINVAIDMALRAAASRAP